MTEERTRTRRLVATCAALAGAVLAAGGCRTAERLPVPVDPAVTTSARNVDLRTTPSVPPSGLVPAANQAHAEPGGGTAASSPPATRSAATLGDFTTLGLERNPRLARASFAIGTARGRAVQAGLYPNPVASVTGDELGDRQGPGGIWTAPMLSQEIVTGGKLGLAQAAASREVDQAGQALASERYLLLASIRQAYYDALAVQRRSEILDELVTLAGKSVETTKQLLEAKQVAPLDVVQLEVEAERLKAEAEATRRELPAAYKRLATAVGDPNLPVGPLAGQLDGPLPDYDLERTQRYVLASHPDVKAASLAVERANLLLRKAHADVVPNVTVSTGYVRQNQNRSDDWMVGVSLPLPLWNRNQGGIAAATAHVGEAVQDVRRVEVELADRVAGAFREFAAARERAARFKGVRERADEAFQLIRDSKARTTLQLLEAQRAVALTNLEIVRAAGDAWKAASVLSGLTLEEQWPPPAPPGGVK